MSDGRKPTFRVVAEGKTDFIVIKALLGRICGQDVVVTMLQPYYSGRVCGPLGEGWEGVRNWCRECTVGYEGLARRVGQEPLRSVSAVIIHVDADIAADDQVQCEKPCPPASATVEALEEIVLGWAGEKQVPDRVVICIPSKATEAWILAALHPEDKLVGPGLECRTGKRHPQESLKQRREGLVSGKDNHKDVDAYAREAPRIAASWESVHVPCPHAKKFHDEVMAIIAAGESDL